MTDTVYPVLKAWQSMELRKQTTNTLHFFLMMVHIQDLHCGKKNWMCKLTENVTGIHGNRWLRIVWRWTKYRQSELSHKNENCYKAVYQCKCSPSGSWTWYCSSYYCYFLKIMEKRCDLESNDESFVQITQLKLICSKDYKQALRCI